MRSIRYVLAALAVLASAAPAGAQSDPKAAVAALDTVVRKYSNYKSVLDPFVEKVYSKFRKSAEVATGIARSYYSFSRPAGQPYYTFVTRDSANAYKYIALAIEAKPDYVPAYIFGGDIQVTMADREAAADWYRRAIKAGPANPAGYLAFADLVIDDDSAAAVSTLEGIRSHLPDFPVELALARIYEKRNDLRNAVACFDRAERDSMNAEDLVSYAMFHYLLGNFPRSLDVALYGHGRFAGNPALNRLAFWNHTDLKNYDEALAFADLLFNKSENPEIQPKDYLYYGYAYLGKKRYAEAVGMFGRLAASADAEERDKNTAMQEIARAYQSMGDYGKAADACRAYIAKREKDSLLSAYDLNMLAQIYIEQGDSLPEGQQASAWQRADSVLSVMTDRFPANADYALYWRLVLAAKQDPESTEGLGLPHAQRLAAVIQAMPERSDIANARLVFAYRYLGYYYSFVLNRRAQGRVYWEKILEIEPENNAARTVLGLKG